MPKRLPFLALVLLSPVLITGQDIDDLLEEAAGSSTEYVYATFKSTHIISGQSVERMPEGQLDFRISHRFGTLNSGAYELWGLDQANIHFGFDYGITDWLQVGIGRGTYEKTYDGSLKFTILRQCKGEKNMPVSFSYFTSMAINTLKWELPGELPFWDRVSYVHQLLVARKFGERFSFEINPTYVHQNMVDTELDPNDIFSVGGGGRFKLTKRLSINAEYYYVIPPLNDYRTSITYHPFSIGLDLETGGHVFQIHLTNSLAMTEEGFITNTTDRWLDGGIHIGFNISRVFTLY
jgi:hypothetical protein